MYCTKMPEYDVRGCTTDGTKKWKDTTYCLWHYHHCTACRKKFPSDQANAYICDGCESFLCYNADCALHTVDKAYCAPCSDLLSKATDDHEGPLLEANDDYEGPLLAEEAHETQETIVNEIQKDHRVALSACVPNGNQVEDADKVLSLDNPWAAEVPDLVSAIYNLRLSYNKQYQVAQQEPSQIIRCALFGAVSSLKRMTDSLVERMESAEYRKRCNLMEKRLSL